MGDTSGARILVIDDSPEILASLTALLRPHYRVLVSRTGNAGIETALRSPQPNLILLDVMMPEMDGYAVLMKLRESPFTCNIPVIFLTSLAGAEDEERGLEVGASDYLSKPIKPAVLLARVRNQLEAKQTRDWLRNRDADLEAEVAKRMAENDLAQAVMVRALAHLAEIRDRETANHFFRTQNYVRLLAQLVREQPRFSGTLTDRYIDLLTTSAVLHDIGKIGIPDHILLKPGPLSPDEFEIMKIHAALGADAITMAERDLERPLPFLSLAKEIARWHHERWDGSGYPDALSGERIPISARLMAVADVFDALVSGRLYKPRISFEEARELIQEGRGSQFDPDLVDAFLEHFEKFVAIAEKYADGDQ